MQLPITTFLKAMLLLFVTELFMMIAIGVYNVDLMNNYNKTVAQLIQDRGSVDKYVVEQGDKISKQSYHNRFSVAPETRADADRDTVGFGKEIDYKIKASIPFYWFPNETVDYTFHKSTTSEYGNSKVEAHPMVQEVQFVTKPHNTVVATTSIDGNDGDTIHFDANKYDGIDYTTLVRNQTLAKTNIFTPDKNSMTGAINFKKGKTIVPIKVEVKAPVTQKVEFIDKNNHLVATTTVIGKIGASAKFNANDYFDSHAKLPATKEFEMLPAKGLDTVELDKTHTLAKTECFTPDKNTLSGTINFKDGANNEPIKVYVQSVQRNK